jgi:Ser/Thr protein kinase RdoA (MazF antagonist)
MAKLKQIKHYGSGHINDTYHVKNTNQNQPDYLLQRINSYVFKNVPLLVSNIETVTTHIKNKLTHIEGSMPDKQVLTLIKTTDAAPYYLDADGNYWRMYIFLKDTIGYDMVTTTNQANEGGKAFGRFQSLISDLDAQSIGETIPNFHNIEMRLENLNNAIAHDSKGRVANTTAEIAFVKARAESQKEILNLGRSGKLPLRITHNDTKFNNVLLDKNDLAQCVIDLDTVMPGYIAYDFGDAIRTIVNTAAEDEADTSKIDINISLYEAFSKGFLKETASFLSAEEINSLPMGALLLPYIVGMRFLTDHLEGDKYFKTHFTGHNLQRARAQFQLLKKLEDNYTQLQDIVQKTAQQYNNSLLINN